MLQPISGAPPVGFISYHLSQTQCSQHMAYPGHAPANRLGDLTRRQILILGQRLDDGKGDWVSQ